MTSLINASSPLVWDDTMLAAAEIYAAANQACIITPFILAGAMAPATSAGVVAQTLAEALAGMTFVQLVRPGAPVVFGSFASSMSMQTGAPTFGTPEPAHVLYTVAALARRLGVPFRSGGSLTASKTPDAQAAYESAATLIPTVMAGTNFVLHAAGWLEGGLAIGYEKFMMDCDQLGLLSTFTNGLDLSDNGLALDAIWPKRPATTSWAANTPSRTSKPHSPAPSSPTTPASSNGQKTARSTLPPEQTAVEDQVGFVRTTHHRRGRRCRIDRLRRPAQGRATRHLRMRACE